MQMTKKWKTDWELQTISFEQLWLVIQRVVTKQLDHLDFDEVTLESSFTEDYEADSVDIVAMLLYLEEMFKNASPTTRTVVPTDKLGKILLVEDLFDVIYEVLLGIELKMEVVTKIRPDFDVLEKRDKVGHLYPKE
jgi:acyl carrier protein